MASAVLDELRGYLEKESGYDALVVHGIVEAVSADGQTREEAAEIAQVYLEGNARALELVGDYFAAVDFDSGLGEEGQADPPVQPEVSAPPGFEAPRPERVGAETTTTEGASTSPAREDEAAQPQSKGKRSKAKKVGGSGISDLLEDLDRVTVPGRRPCECQATRHDLVANCLSCGRVVCAQEGEGPCLYCGCLVTRDREVRYAALLERQRENEGSSVGDGGGAATREKVERAIGEKERLVGYDRESARQTAIIDDQSDFFEIDENIWLSQEEKAFLAKRREEQEEREAEDAKRVYVTFDLIGRKVVSAGGRPDDEAASIPPNPSSGVPAFRGR